MQIKTADILEIKRIIQPSCNRLCRGQSNEEWPLNCSFFRNNPDEYVTCQDLFGMTWNASDENLLKTTFPSILDNSAIKAFPHLGFLVQLQQNYNRSTPLLDVSYDIFMPLFCACGGGKENMDKNGKIFIIEYCEYVSVYGKLDNPEMNVLNNENMPIYNDRMRIQSGAMIKTCVFLGGKLHFCDISKANNKRVSEFIIPKELKPQILKNLKCELKTNDLEEYFYGYTTKSPPQN